MAKPCRNGKTVLKRQNGQNGESKTAKRQNGETAKRQNGKTAKRKHQNGKTENGETAKRQNGETDKTAKRQNGAKTEPGSMASETVSKRNQAQWRLKAEVRSQSGGDSQKSGLVRVVRLARGRPG